VEVGDGSVAILTGQSYFIIRYIMDVVKMKKRNENGSQEMKSFSEDGFELQVREINWQNCDKGSLIDLTFQPIIDQGLILDPWRLVQRMLLDP
jgi:hypothetical protein